MRGALEEICECCINMSPYSWYGIIEERDDNLEELRVVLVLEIRGKVFSKLTQAMEGSISDSRILAFGVLCPDLHD